jgi:putative ABC transport system permease protein
MSVVWAKIRRDLGQNKARTALVVLSIAVGVFALGFIYGAHDMKVSYSQTGHDVQEESRSVFEIIAILLLAMSVLAAVVGGIGLMGTMSINVLERRREIGMMRATGATSPVVAGIFIFEGVLIGVLSWVLAVPLSYPAARLFGRVVGDTLLSADLYFRYSVAGTLAWLVIVVVVAVLASLWPALQATRVSVREALAYE